MLLFFSCRSLLLQYSLGLIIVSLERKKREKAKVCSCYCSILLGFIIASPERKEAAYRKTWENAMVCFCSLVVEVGYCSILLGFIIAVCFCYLVVEVGVH